MSSNPAECILLVYIRGDFFLAYKLTCGKRESVSKQHSMKNRRAVGLLNPMICAIKNYRQEPGGRRDDTCDHGLLSRSWKVHVCEKKKKYIPPFFHSVLGSCHSHQSLCVSFCDDNIFGDLFGAALGQVLIKFADSYRNVTTARKTFFKTGKITRGGGAK